MGGITPAAHTIATRAADEPDFQQELLSKPREVLERELGRPLTDEELQMATDELKKYDIHVPMSNSNSDKAGTQF